jgi:hypothetical protein
MRAAFACTPQHRRPIGTSLPGEESWSVVIRLDLDHFAARVLQDALTRATAQYWLHRAYQFQQAAPRPEEFHGNATVEELRQRWRECMALAQACLRHAELLRDSAPEHISDEVWDALEEVA